MSPGTISCALSSRSRPSRTTVAALGCELLEGGEGLLGAPFLHEADGAVEDDDGEDRRRVGVVREPRRDDAGGDEHEDHEIGELGGEDAPRPARWGALDDVPPVLRQPRLGLAADRPRSASDWTRAAAAWWSSVWNGGWSGRFGFALGRAGMSRAFVMGAVHVTERGWADQMANRSAPSRHGSAE